MENSKDKKNDRKDQSQTSGSGSAFLFKPVFFIFSLLCASWLVLKIEQLSPSDFGKYRSLFESSPAPRQGKELPDSKKKQLKKLVIDYKSGLLDSTLFDRKMDELFKEN